ncbi:MAG: hypothetical protein J6O40_07200 [Ruminococcus sp.]|nr:hypothetical protein [Ruminococcus sp.]
MPNKNRKAFLFPGVTLLLTEGAGYLTLPYIFKALSSVLDTSGNRLHTSAVIIVAVAYVCILIIMGDLLTRLIAKKLAGEREELDRKLFYLRLKRADAVILIADAVIFYFIFR